MKRAFTLIELMVVISIIGILGAITLPRFTDITEDARVAQVQGNLTNLRTSIEMFNVKNERYPAYEETLSPSPNSDGKTDISSDGSLSEEFADFYSKSILPETPASEETPATNQVVEERDNTGGWLYQEEEGKVYANLKDGHYTGDEVNEVWGETTSSEDDKDNDGGDNGEGSSPAPAPDPGEKTHLVTGSDLESFIKSGGWLEDFLSDLEYNEYTEALELKGLLTIGRIKLDTSNTELEEVSKISLKTNSELEGWELTGGPDEKGHYTYSQNYDPPKSTSGDGFEVEVDFDGFLGIFDDHSIYEISYE